LNSDGGFQLIFTHRYLLLIAALVLLSNLVNSTGEFILGKSVSDFATAAVGLGDETMRQQYIGEFYADFYFWVNLVGAVLQMFAVSRIMHRTGVAPALFLVPMVALGGYTLLSFAPALFLIRGVKIAENGTDYSLQSTARHALFLRTSPEAKYKAKTAIDSFFWRAGDAFSGLIVFVGTMLAFDLRTYARANAILTLVWLIVAAGILWLRVKEPEFDDDSGPGLPAPGLSFATGSARPGITGFEGIRAPIRTEAFSPCLDPDREAQQWRAEDGRTGRDSGLFPP
jgi:AAA family ATP:ADP antiporter